MCASKFHFRDCLLNTFVIFVMACETQSWLCVRLSWTSKSLGHASVPTELLLFMKPNIMGFINSTRILKINCLCILYCTSFWVLNRFFVPANKVRWGHSIDQHPSVRRLSICLSVDRIVSALYLPQY